MTASCEEPLTPQVSNPCSRRNIIDSECSLYTKDPASYRSDRHSKLPAEGQDSFKVGIGNLTTLIMAVIKTALGTP